jgi:hypothetical protein
MSFIRPEIAQKLNRWREALAGAGSAALGIVWITTESGALAIIGTVLTIGGALLIFAGIQRARFRQGSGGPGLVQLDEGQLTYFGPFEGGSIPVETLTMLELDPSQEPAAHWILSHSVGETLNIPVNAEGAEALFDVFAALPGIDTKNMLDRLQDQPDEKIVIWQKDRPALH